MCDKCTAFRGTDGSLDPIRYHLIYSEGKYHFNNRKIINNILNKYKKLNYHLYTKKQSIINNIKSVILKY